MAPLFGNSLIYGGDTLTTNDSSHFILAQFDASGMLMMTKTAVSPNNFFVNSVSVHKNRVLLTGKFQHHISFGNESLMSMNDKVKNSFVIGYDLTGNLLYLKKMDSRKGCEAKWVTAGKTVYLSGSFSDTAYFDDIVIVKDQHDFFGGFLAMLEEDIQPPDTDTESFNIYPNPAVGSLTIEYQPLYQGVSLEIFDLHGKLVDKYIPLSPSITIDVGHLHDGLYIIKLNTAEKVVFRKFLKL